MTAYTLSERVSPTDTLDIGGVVDNSVPRVGERLSIRNLSGVSRDYHVVKVDRCISEERSGVFECKHIVVEVKSSEE